MGTLSEFICEQCGYRAEVSGGKDWGMIAVVETMTCRRCRILVNVLIGREGKEGPTGDPDYDKDLGICPECRGKDLAVWKNPGPCPRCNGRMIEGELKIDWD